MRASRWFRACLGALLVGAVAVVGAAPAGAVDVTVSTEAQLRAALADPATTIVTLASSIDLVDCSPTGGDLDRTGTLVLDGGGFTLRQTCAGERVLESTAGTLTLQHVTITGGDLYDALMALGGGVRAVGDLALVDTTVTSNRVATDVGALSDTFAGGGGVASDGATSLTDSHVDANTVVGNRIGWGGGVHAAHQSSVSVTDSTVDSNTISCATAVGLAFCGGGGVSTLPIDVIGGPSVPHGAGDVALTRASVRGNVTTVTGDDSSETHAWAMGGGVHAVTLDATEAHVDDNSLAVDADYDTNAFGGGVVASDGATLVQSTVDENSVTSTGTTFVSARSGGLTMDGDLTATDSSISHNSVRARSDGSAAQMGGGGAYRADLTRVTIEGNVVEGGNHASAGGLSAYIASVSSSTISDNVARSTSAEGVAYAGGLVAHGGRVDSTTVSGNSSLAAGDAHAGGVLHTVQVSFDPNVPDPALTVVNSTVAGNVASGAHSWAGGLEEVSGWDTTMVFSTVSGNSAAVGANLAVGPRLPDFPNDPTGGTIVATATVLADPRGGGASCEAVALASDAFVHATDASCGTTPMGDPLLAALGDNGGSTSTMLPAATSPLLDLVPTDGCLALVTVDQRGVTRPQGSACDVGAVEVEVGSPTPEPAPEPTSLPDGANGPTAPAAVVVDPRLTG